MSLLGALWQRKPDPPDSESEETPTALGRLQKMLDAGRESKSEADWDASDSEVENTDQAESESQLAIGESSDGEPSADETNPIDLPLTADESDGPETDQDVSVHMTTADEAPVFESQDDYVERTSDPVSDAGNLDATPVTKTETETEAEQPDDTLSALRRLGQMLGDPTDATDATEATTEAVVLEPAFAVPEAVPEEVAEAVPAVDRIAAEPADTAEQHEALMALRAELEQAEARGVELQQNLSAQLEEARHEALAEAAQRHDLVLLELRTQTDDAQARLAQVERELATRVEEGREAGAAHDAQVAELKTQAAEQVEAAVGQARAEMSHALAETSQVHDTALARLRANIDQAEARRAELEQTLAESGPDHDAALGQVRAEAEQAQARLAEVEQELASRIEATRQDASEANATHASQLSEVQARAAEQVESAARQAQAEMNQALAETAQQHEAALAAARAESEQAQVRLAEVERELASQMETARTDASAAHASQVSEVERSKPKRPNRSSRRYGRPRRR